MQAKNKRRSKGLGDTVEKVLQATGIDKVVKFIAGEDCGCNERKARLNALIPYKQPLCLLEEEHAFLKHFLVPENMNYPKPTHALELFRIYDRVMQNKAKTNTTCNDCYRRIVKEMKQIMNEYEDINI